MAGIYDLAMIVNARQVQRLLAHFGSLNVPDLRDRIGSIAAAITAENPDQLREVVQSLLEEAIPEEGDIRPRRGEIADVGELGTWVQVLTPGGVTVTLGYSVHHLAFFIRFQFGRWSCSLAGNLLAEIAVRECLPATACSCNGEDTTVGEALACLMLQQVQETREQVQELDSTDVVYRAGAGPAVEN